MYIITIKVESEEDKETILELIEQVDEAGAFEESVSVQEETTLNAF